ncbi:MAG TPA: adenylate/guanylate cyclase domain-containing protein [Thermoleophilaceae bacterium]|nr:adenylate/guanylate cyclase domain-containing protein [Thermoleophilaceae bacterium]
MRRERLRTVLFLLVGAAAVVITLALYLAPRWKPVKEAFASTTVLEDKSVDARFAIRGNKKPPSDLVVVGIDDTTFQDLQQRWPFRRSYHARVIDRLRRDGAKLIVFDVQFTEPQGDTNQDIKDDNALLLACRRAGNCVMASTEFNAAGQSTVFGGPAGQKFARTVVGNGNVLTDPDGVIRRIYYKQQHVKPLGVVAYERLTGKKVTRSDLGRDTTYVDYAGPGGTIKRISYSHVCPGCGQTSHNRPIRIPQAPPGYFKGKIVVVGPVAPSLQDIHETPYDAVMPGAEYQANVLQTARDGFPLHDSPTWLDIVLIVVLGLVPALASIRVRLWGIVVAIAVGIVYTLIAQVAFDNGTVMSFTYPVGALFLSSVGSLAVHYVTEAFERQRVRDVFSRFVPESVVGDVLEESDGARLGGVGRHATVMFSDLRGFTSFAEQFAPDQVIRILNRYLTAMVDDAIIPNGGTLVDYMGDGIMAVFGAPIEMPDHADHALAAARAKLHELEKFNQWIRAEYGLEKSFRMGIGLNSGEVMSGNVGSEKRLAYTAIGDTTNTAARLEGMTKGTDYMLLMAESTKSALSTAPSDLTPVGEHEIRGRVEKLSLWSVEESRKTKEDGGSFASVAEGRTLADK